MTGENDPLMKPEDVAERLQVSMHTIEYWRAKRTGPKFVKIGEGKRAPVRYRKSEVEAYVKEGDQ